jgi:hypothetical protein
MSSRFHDDEEIGPRMLARRLHKILGLNQSIPVPEREIVSGLPFPLLVTESVPL